MRYAEIIAVGSELLLGGRLDTNSLFLTERLGKLGIEVRFKSVVGDDEPDIESALRTACRRADLVVMTGGLGPTEDDCTRQAVAGMTGRPLRRRIDAVAAIRRRLLAWGRVPTHAQLRQALIPSGADILDNPVGSAPGFALRWRRCLIAVLPGVPSEAERMFDLALLPYLQADGSTSRLKACLDRRVLHTFGLIEAEVDRRLQGLLPNGSEVRLGMLASPLGVSVSLTACGETSAERASVMDRAVRAVRARLRRYIYAEGDETMEQVVGRQLSRLGLQVAVAESCTGGLIGHRLTQVPGSSAYFDRGVISYSNEAKQDLLGVPIGLLRRYGAVSAEVAAAMAAGIRARSRADVGLSITGIAGPCGGTERKPVGLVYVGLDAQGRSKTSGRSMRIAQEFRFHGDRSTIKLRSSQAALNVLRRWLMTSKRSVS